jgi:hypothetical protein
MGITRRHGSIFLPSFRFLCMTPPTLRLFPAPYRLTRFTIAGWPTILPESYWAIRLNWHRRDIYDQPIIFIPIATQRLSVLYTIMVRQYGLTEAAYNFLYMMEQNSEALGTIFDPQPSQLTGNIQCLTNPSEPVVGYVSAGAGAAAAYLDQSGAGTAMVLCVRLYGGG